MVQIEIEKAQAFLHSGRARKTIHSLTTIFVVEIYLFVCFYFCFFILPCLLINSITYMSNNEEKSSHTHKCGALYFIYHRVQHHHHAISFPHERNALWIMCLCTFLVSCVVYHACQPTNHIHILLRRPNLLCNSVNALCEFGRPVVVFVRTIYLTHFGGIRDCLPFIWFTIFPYVLHFISISQLNTMWKCDSSEKYKNESRKWQTIKSNEDDNFSWTVSFSSFEL